MTNAIEVYEKMLQKRNEQAHSLVADFLDRLNRNGELIKEGEVRWENPAWNNPCILESVVNELTGKGYIANYYQEGFIHVVWDFEKPKQVLVKKLKWEGEVEVLIGSFIGISIAVFILYGILYSFVGGICWGVDVGKTGADVTWPLWYKLTLWWVPLTFSAITTWVIIYLGDGGKWRD